MDFMAAPVFVSYSSKDDVHVRALVSALEARGIACWISGRDVAPGENFGDSIVDAIERAPAMVLVFSYNANGSEEIKKEIVLASQRRMAIVPVRIEDATPSKSFRYELATRNWIDLFPNWDKGVAKLSERLTAIANATIVDLPPATTLPPTLPPPPALQQAPAPGATAPPHHVSQPAPAPPRLSSPATAPNRNFAYVLGATGVLAFIAVAWVVLRAVTPVPFLPPAIPHPASSAPPAVSPSAPLSPTPTVPSVTPTLIPPASPRTAAQITLTIATVNNGDMIRQGRILNR